MACELAAQSSKLTRVKECSASPEHAVQSSKKLPQELGNTLCLWGAIGSLQLVWYMIQINFSLHSTRKNINEVIVSLNSISVSINCWVKLPVIVSFCACSD